MLSSEEDVEVHALRKRGWSIAAIARHTGRDRKTIRAYLNGDRQPGVRVRHAEDPFETFVPYLTQRLADDAHVMATALYEEAVALGYPRSYATFTRQLRDRTLRPVCAACTSSSSRTATTEIDHPPGEETQWDWVELPQAPWLDGGTADVLVGALAHSGRFRAVIAEATDQPHTLDAIGRIVAGLGGTTRRWRFDRMGTVVAIGTGRVLPSFAAFAKHYAVAVDICPAYRAKRKGVVEKANHFIATRWWRTADVQTLEDAQDSLDAFCETIGDARPRHDAEGRSITVGAMADAESLRPLPATRYPIVLEVTRTVTPTALVHYNANRYATDPVLIGQQVTVRHHLHTHILDILDPASGLLTRHRIAAGRHVTVRDGAQARSLQRAVFAAFTTDKPCHRKAHRPPSAAAKALAAQLQGEQPAPGDAVVIDLATWAAHVPEAGR